MDIILQHSEGGVDSALLYAKTISKYMKDLIGYVEKRLSLGVYISLEPSSFYLCQSFSNKFKCFFLCPSRDGVLQEPSETVSVLQTQHHTSKHVLFLQSMKAGQYINILSRS